MNTDTANKQILSNDRSTKKGRNAELKKRAVKIAASALLLSLSLPVLLSLSACSRLNGSYDAENKTYADVDLKEQLGITFDSIEYTDIPEAAAASGLAPSSFATESNYPAYVKRSFRVFLREEIKVYDNIGDTVPSKTYGKGKAALLTETENPDWMMISNVAGSKYGYTNEGFLHTVSEGCEVYAELPIEYGMAKTNAGTTVPAYSHLVDVSKYLKCYFSTDYSNAEVDLTSYDVKVSMKLSTYDTTIGEPFYGRNLCLLQYDTIQKLIKAIEKFKADGYTVVIYDAYRPTSVQQRWFDVVRVHKWVADPSIGMGGVHDRGTAIDMSLIDRDGKELEMPTPMHTFTEASARSSTEMTETARANMDYMKEVMVGCGFTYINSEWWHFQDVNTKYYLPTDHPIDTIPLVASEESPW